MGAIGVASGVVRFPLEVALRLVAGLSRRRSAYYYL